MSKEKETQVKALLDEHEKVIMDNVFDTICCVRAELEHDLYRAIWNGDYKKSMRWSGAIMGIDSVLEELFDGEDEDGVYGG